MFDHRSIRLVINKSAAKILWTISVLLRPWSAIRAAAPEHIGDWGGTRQPWRRRQNLALSIGDWLNFLETTVRCVLLFILFLFLRSLFISCEALLGQNEEIQPQFSGWDLLLGSIGAFYVISVPYTKVEESFNVQVCLIRCLCFSFQNLNSHYPISVNFLPLLFSSLIHWDWKKHGKKVGCEPELICQKHVSVDTSCPYWFLRILFHNKLIEIEGNL